jgi:2OG-Fe(II) oxygenase superfamily
MNISRAKHMLVVSDFITTLERNFVKSLALEDKWSEEKNNRNDEQGRWYRWRSLQDMYLGKEKDYRAKYVKEIQDRAVTLVQEQFPELGKLKVNWCGVSAQTAPFVYHADCEYPEVESERDLGMPEATGYNTYKKPTSKWIPNYVPTRVYTSVIYLNDNFNGGETIMPDHAFDVKPVNGLLFGFPCDRNYVHGVRPTTNGIRYAFTSWYEKDV